MTDEPTIWDSIEWDRGERRGVIRGGVYDGLPVGMVHCDPLVLHAPGACWFCDEHGADMQAERKERGIAFTDDTLYANLQCPARAQRGENCQLWGGMTGFGGNKPAGTRAEYDERWAEWYRTLDEAVAVEALHDAEHGGDADAQRKRRDG